MLTYGSSRMPDTSAEYLVEMAFLKKHVNLFMAYFSSAFLHSIAIKWLKRELITWLVKHTAITKTKLWFKKVSNYYVSRLQWGITIEKQLSGAFGFFLQEAQTEKPLGKLANPPGCGDGGSTMEKAREIQSVSTASISPQFYQLPSGPPRMSRSKLKRRLSSSEMSCSEKTQQGLLGIHVCLFCWNDCMGHIIPQLEWLC